MAAIVRRNWPAVLVMACAVLLALSLVMPHVFQRATVAQVTDTQTKSPTYTVQSPEDYDGLRNLRYELGLDNDALSALNPTADTAEQVLAALRNWYEQNQSALHAQNLAVGQKTAALQSLERQIRIGPRDEAVLAARPKAVQELEAARAQRQKFLEGGVAAVRAGLSADNQTALATLRANQGEALPYRLLALTAAQKTALQNARREHELGSTAAADAQSRQTSDRTWNQQLATILSAAQQQTLASYTQYASAAAERVLAAQQKVTPAPEEADAGLAPETPRN
jgi:hypothetical protein